MREPLFTKDGWSATRRRPRSFPQVINWTNPQAENAEEVPLDPPAFERPVYYCTKDETTVLEQWYWDGELWKKL